MKIGIVILAVVLAVYLYGRIFHRPGTIWIGTTGAFVKAGFVLFVIAAVVLWNLAEDAGFIKEEGDSFTAENQDDSYEDTGEAEDWQVQERIFTDMDVSEDEYSEDTFLGWEEEYSDSGLEEYIFEDSDSRILEDSEIEACSADELALARNEIYARHGRRFNDESLQEYFNTKSWYEGTVEQEDFDDGVFNKFEKANMKKIAEYE